MDAVNAGTDFVVTRVFDAPRHRVWKAWTEAERLKKWWGPKGCTLRVIKLELRPGGIFHYGMQFKADRETYGRIVYREVTAPERLVFVVSFADADGEVTRAPFSETWPLGMLNTVTLADESGTTRLTLRGSPVDSTEAERATFASMFDSMRQGFGGTFDQLTEYLATQG